jgi:hypothetical protein
MSTPDKDDVSTALGLLLETLGEEKQRLNDEGAKAMKIGDFATATAVIQFAQRLLSFQEEVEVLTENWKELEDLRDDASPQVREIVGDRIFTVKPPRPSATRSSSQPVATPETVALCIHILEALVGLGGHAKNQDVSTLVNKRVKMLYPKFRQARQMLTDKKWTTSNSPTNSLVISDKGRKWVENELAKRSKSAPELTRKATNTED